MVINQSTNKIGEFIDFEYQVPLRGMKTIVSLVENIVGTTGTRYFDKYFCYSYDGIRFNDFAPLTLGALTALNPLPLKNDLIFRFRYIRSGTDVTGVLTLNSFVISGIYDLEYLKVLKFSDTVFKDIEITDLYWNRVWLNLLQKTYDREIVPKYIVRGDDNLDDVDYITFWKTVAYYFSLTIALVDYKITKIQDNPELMLDFLEGSGMFVCNDETIEELNLIASQMYDTARRRGTKQIVLQDGDHLTPVVNPFHGELLRYICYDIVLDEFLFEYLSRGLTGWNVNNSSPLFRGLTNHLQLNKTPENTQDFNNLSLFDLVGTVDLFTDGSKQVARLQGGITSLQTKEIKVDSKVDYEITFFVRQLSGINNVTFELDCYNEVGGLIDSFNVETGAVRNYFFQQIQLGDINEYYFVRGIIYKAGSSLLIADEATTNINQGRNLIFHPDCKRVVIRIKNDQVGITDLYLWDLKMKPVKTDYNSGGFVNSLDFVNMWLKNNNQNVDSRELQKNVQNYLLPYGTILKINQL